MDEPPLTSLSLTHVRYDPSDRLAHLSAWLALVPQALCVMYVTLIWATREVEVLLMFGGQMACELLNFALKRLIKEERPQQMHGKGYGMPSSHAQFVAYFSLSLTFFLLARHKPSDMSPHLRNKTAEALLHPTYRQSSFSERAFLSLIAICGAAAVALSRIYLSYHTPKQVLVGVVAGTLFAFVWFSIMSALRSQGWIEWALDTQLARLVRIRDLIVSEDLQDSGWARWEARRSLASNARSTKPVKQR